MDRHSDLNVPRPSFSKTPISQYSQDTGHDWYATATAAATLEADLANFQLTGVWT
eukprot:SAG31_NODE_17903_length_654_cov_0.881081_1_plen_54_part_10